MKKKRTSAPIRITGVLAMITLAKPEVAAHNNKPHPPKSVTAK